MATHSSVFAWRIPGAGEPGGLTSMGSHRVRHDWSDLAAAAAAIYYDVLKYCHMSVLNYISNPLKTNAHTAFDNFPLFQY